VARRQAKVTGTSVVTELPTGQNGQTGRPKQAGQPTQPNPASGAKTGGDTGSPVADRLADLFAFARRRLAGDYVVDEYGFDADLTDHLVLPPLRQLYRNWFRVEVIGASNLPRPAERYSWPTIRAPCRWTR
jgi:hypothetical protein